MARLQCGEGRMIIDSVAWAQYINVTDGQPRRHSKCRASVLRLAAKISPEMISLQSVEWRVRLCVLSHWCDWWKHKSQEFHVVKTEESWFVHSWNETYVI